MPISIREFRDFCEKVILNKDQSGRIRTDQFNQAVNYSSTTLLNQNTDNTKEYRFGAPTSPVKWQASRAVTQALRHLLTRSAIAVSTDGQMPLPADCYYPSDLRMPYYKNPGDCVTAEPWGTVPQNRPITILRNDQMAGVLTSDLRKPSLQHPYGEHYDTYIQLYPTTIRAVWFSYLRYPREARYAVTFSPSGKEVFDPVLSVDIDWPQHMRGQLAYITLTYLGFNIRDLDTTQLGLNLEKTQP